MPELHHPLSIRIYWEDTDAGGIVFYANYLKFFERARTELLRKLGIHQQTLRDETGAMFVVAEVQLRYLGSARLDDEITVSTQVLEVGAASIVFMQQAWRGDTLLTEGRVRAGCVDGATLRPRRIPAIVVNALKGPDQR